MGKILTPDQIKMEECQNAIGKILKQYGMSFQPYFTCIGGQISQGINIVKNTEISPQELGKAMGDIHGG